MEDIRTTNSQKPEKESRTVTETAQFLQERVSRLLAKTNGINESRAKQLRKEWDELETDTAISTPQKEKLASLFEDLRQRIHVQVENRDKAFADTEKLVEDLRESVTKGDLKTSEELENQIITGLNKIFGLSDQRRQSIISQLDSLRPKMQSLSSWRHWGTIQAREKVIDEIRDIHKNEKNLEKIARRIKQARDEWREWDKSGEGGDHKLYKTFDAVCSEAYKPCQVHFDKQKKQREQATLKRTQCCEMLEKEFENVDWREPDWKKLQQLVRSQVSFWRKSPPGDFKHRKPLQTRFDSIIQKFDDRLERERARNYKQRTALIQEIEELNNMEDVFEALKVLGDYKKKWQVTVTSKRNQEQKLWKKFTTACDALYQKRSDQKQKNQQELSANLKAKRELCKLISDKTQSMSEPEDNIQSQVTQWQSEWKEIGGVPRKDKDSIEKEFRSNLKRYQDRHKKYIQSHQKQEESLLMEKAEVCINIENQLQGEAVEVSTEDIAKIRQQWDQMQALPEEVQAKLDQRIESALNSVSDAAARSEFLNKLDANQQQVEDLLLQLEVCADIESPAQFAKQRMALQIERLSAAMGKSKGTILLPREQLISEIMLTGPVPAVSSELNLNRLQKCRSALNP